MSELVFFLEELSARAMLERLMPRVISDEWTTRFFPFEGKQDLEKNIQRRLRGYLKPGARFIILRDQDAGDCRHTKQRLKRICDASGRSGVIVRIACHELESWYLADFAALAAAYNKPGLLKLAEQARYRDPDSIVSPSRDLKRIIPEYQKVDGSRRIGDFLDPENTKSKSFSHLINAVRMATSS